MSCLTLSERLHHYVDGELPQAERREVEAHLATCAVCREARAALEGLGALLRRELVDPGAAAAAAGTWAAIAARLDGEEAPGGVAALPRPTGRRFVRIPRFGRPRERARSWRRVRPLLAGAAAAAALAVAVSVALRFQRGPADEAATVAAVESGGEAAVILLAGTDTQPPIILVSEAAAPRGADAPF